MLRIACVLLIGVTVGLIAWGAITLYDENLKVGRMWETLAIKPHEAPLPLSAGHRVPFNGGETLYRQAHPATLQAPFDIKLSEMVAAGKVGYQRYCVHCHGKQHDGLGTVGQSFAPLPGDLRSTKVQSLAPGIVFYEISYGVPGGRQPALATTIAVHERWQIVAYVRSLGIR